MDNMDLQIYKDALEVLRSGGVILYPTDTVWGLGCDATNPEAVARIYGIKHRSDSKALVLLASDLDMVARYVQEIPDIALQLVEVNDAPMTIVYPGAVCGSAPKAGESPVIMRNRLAYNAVAEDGTVAIRIPMSEFCRNLAYRLGRPVVSTSANISGQPSPVRRGEIAPEISSAVDYTVPENAVENPTGKPSQIIKVGLGGEIQVIR